MMGALATIGGIAALVVIVVGVAISIFVYLASTAEWP
jgi:hypothetical protein